MNQTQTGTDENEEAARLVEVPFQAAREALGRALTDEETAYVADLLLGLLNQLRAGMSPSQFTAFIKAEVQANTVH